MYPVHGQHSVSPETLTLLQKSTLADRKSESMGACGCASLGTASRATATGSSALRAAVDRAHASCMRSISSTDSFPRETRWRGLTQSGFLQTRRTFVCSMRSRPDSWYMKTVAVTCASPIEKTGIPESLWQPPVQIQHACGVAPRWTLLQNRARIFSSLSFRAHPHDLLLPFKSEPSCGVRTVPQEQRARTRPSGRYSMMVH